MRVDRLPAPNVTARVLSVLDDQGHRPGGIGHTALALLGADADVAPICAVGDDGAGLTFTAALEAAGCRTDGIATLAGRSPTAQLLYSPDGATTCLFDPGVDWPELSARQRALIALADVVVVMVGPADVTRGALACSRREATLAWIVKNDPTALLPDVVAALCRRADIVFHNAGESTVIERSLTGRAATVVRTDGPRPVTVTTASEPHSYAVPPGPALRNPTGAGDAFAGGYLAAWLRSADEADCVAAGAAAARSVIGQTR
jgi:ribokinase